MSVEESNEGNQTKNHFFREKINELVRLEPQVENNHLRYIISGSSALYLFQIAESFAYTTVDYESSELVVYHDIPLETQQPTISKSRIPFSRIPGDIDIIPLTTDGSEISMDVDGIFVRDPLAEKLNLHSPNSPRTKIDRSLRNEKNKLRNVVKLKIGEEEYFVDSPEAIIDGKMRQLLSCILAKGEDHFFEDKRLKDTEEIINWSLSNYGLTWTTDVLQPSFSIQTCPDNAYLPWHDNRFASSIIGKISAHILKSDQLYTTYVDHIHSRSSFSAEYCRELENGGLGLLRSVKSLPENTFPSITDFINLVDVPVSQDPLYDIRTLLDITSNLPAKLVPQVLDAWKAMHQNKLDISISGIHAFYLMFGCGEKMINNVSKIINSISSDQNSLKVIQLLLSRLGTVLPAGMTMTSKSFNIEKVDETDASSDKQARLNNFGDGLASIIERNMSNSTIDKIETDFYNYGMQFRSSIRD